MKNLQFFFSILGLIITLVQGQAQKDTVFWFAAPETVRAFDSLDRPVAFRFSTYDQPAIVTVSQPANTNFPPQTLTILPNATGTLYFPPFFSFVENMPPNQVLNKGFLIRATNPISAYYEVIGVPSENPELFVLKGQNALGTDFFIPFQTILSNTNDYTPLPKASFDIVATEDNTQIEIAPTTNLVGRPANVKYTIILNRGQTYSGEAASQVASQRPVGTRVTSDKPIAITIKDDLLEARPVYGNYCRDIMGDQLIPVNKIGTQYILQKGTLNGVEYAFVLAIENGTQVYQNGVFRGTINAGQQITISIGAGSHFIQTSKPAYLYQMTGIGCEVSGAILPALDCTGSRVVRFVRPSPEDFYLYLITRAGNQQGFRVNGAAIAANNFQVVPGSNGAFVAARLPFSVALVPDGLSSVVENLSGDFHMGILNGGSKTGCRYGYFSDFSGVVFRRENIRFCRARKIQVHGLEIMNEGVYYSTHTNEQGCDTIYEVVAQFLPLPVKRDSLWLCPGASVTIGGKEYTQPAVISDTLRGIGEDCDTLRTTVLSFFPVVPSFLPADTAVCLGESITFYSPYPNTVWNYAETGERYTVNAPGRVVASFNDANGCPNRISTNVRWCCSEKGFYIPNAFAPNSDGLNREFCVYPTGGECSSFLLRIFDRWGSLLFETTSPDRCWDGTFRGKPMPTGVYVWVMDIYSDATKRTEILKGDVTLFR